MSIPFADRPFEEIVAHAVAVHMIEDLAEVEFDLKRRGLDNATIAKVMDRVLSHDESFDCRSPDEADIPFDHGLDDMSFFDAWQ